MSQALTHAAIGGTVSLVVILAIDRGIRHPRVWTVVGMAWGLVPDLGSLTHLPLFPSLETTPWADIFWAHRTLDRLDPKDSMLFGVATAVVFLVVLAIAERDGYRRSAR